MKNMGDYQDHYLKKDVLLLTAVFERFINTCLKFQKIDPCHYFSSPRLSWDVMLKMTGIELKKIFDIDMQLFIEKELRGGISYIAKRYSEANNKYIENYDSTKLSVYIEYLDMKNLHGWAMSGCLPYGGFKWLKKVDNFDVNSINSSIGYILEVDLKYPDELHYQHNNYPLAPEKLAIPYEGNKFYQGNKTNYVVHYRNLQLYLSLRMKLTKFIKCQNLSGLTGWKNISILTLKKKKCS